MKLKKGDKLFCKKHLYFQGEYYFEKGKYYTVNEYNNNKIAVCCNILHDVYFDLREINTNDFKFCDHFYTMMELRKKKLNKIVKI